MERNTVNDILNEFDENLVSTITLQTFDLFLMSSSFNSSNQTDVWSVIKIEYELSKNLDLRRYVESSMVNVFQGLARRSGFHRLLHSSSDVILVS